MNPLNYATLEASKRLVEAGIVLETEVSWYDSKQPYLCPTPPGCLNGAGYIPAPSMAEVCRELRQCHTDSKDNYLLTKQATIYHGRYRIGYYNPTKGIWLRYFEGADNNIDDMVDLLIWEQRKEE